MKQLLNELMLKVTEIAPYSSLNQKWFQNTISNPEVQLQRGIIHLLKKKTDPSQNLKSHIDYSRWIETFDAKAIQFYANICDSPDYSTEIKINAKQILTNIFKQCSEQIKSEIKKYSVGTHIFLQNTSLYQLKC